MRMYDIITKKKRGEALSDEEIRFFVNGYTAGDIPDYQVSALLMAIVLKGMTAEETAALTLAITDSGEKADLSRIDGIKADKHSTGGVGDKTTLIAIPIAAACGLKVPKMSGRGLGHTGGTVDKLESITGYKTQVDAQTFADIVNKVGCGVIGQSSDFAPADKKIYALRDVTATVDSIPLIAASIMGKKLAVGADCIVLDVKTGSGAFCKTLEETEALAKAMVDVGRLAGKRITALITDMDRPLGNAIGNSLEVIEAVETLRGKGPADLTEISLAIAAEMLYLADMGSYAECERMARAALGEGRAFDKLVEMVKAFGGDGELLLDTGKFKRAKYCLEIKSPGVGYIAHTNTERLGVASLLLGAGRQKKEDSIDYTAGITLYKKTGDAVKKGDILAVMYCNNPDLFIAAGEEFLAAYTIGHNPPPPSKQIFGRISTKPL